MTDNDFVATATAEKRLREVLAARFPHHTGGLVGELADTLLAGAEITYLPRKRSVSILLRYPETAAPKPSNDKAVDPVPSDGYADKQSYDEAQLAMVVSGPIITPEGNTVTEADIPAVRDPKRPARFGEFHPTVTSAPEYHEDDYFTE